MKRKSIIVLLSTFTLAVSGMVTATALSNGIELTGADINEYEINLNDMSKVVEKDHGYLHQVDVKNNKFDMIGYSKMQGGDFGSIARVTYGEQTFNGMIYNRSIINGFETLTATFSGGDLYYVFSDFLMEDMNFNGTQLTSGEVVNVPEGKAYFILYNPDTTPVIVDSVKVTYSCDRSKDEEMVYSRNSERMSARSWGKEVAVEDSYIEIENNQIAHANNYSRGNHVGTEKDPWYRFCGKSFKQSEELGTDFEFGLTVMGNISQVVNHFENQFDNFFQFNVWPQFTYGNKNDAPWVQTYIGNDNIEPLGTENRLIDDDYAMNSFAGRYFGVYDWFNSDWEVDYDDTTGSWKFGNPDVVKIQSEDITLRQAYERYNLPFWYINFKVYLSNENQPTVDIRINGMLIESYEIFEHYDTVNTPSISMLTMPMHVISYGKDVEGNPAQKYTGMFTYPRLISK